MLKFFVYPFFNHTERKTGHSVTKVTHTSTHSFFASDAFYKGMKVGRRESVFLGCIAFIFLTRRKGSTEGSRIRANSCSFVVCSFVMRLTISFLTSLLKTLFFDRALFY